MSEKKNAIVVGVGAEAGLGAALCKRLAHGLLDFVVYNAGNNGFQDFI